MGATYGDEGITVAVRIGFDDNRSLGARNRSPRRAAGVELMLGCPRKDGGSAPMFLDQMEQRHTRSCRATFRLRFPSTRCWSALRPLANLKVVQNQVEGRPAPPDARTPQWHRLDSDESRARAGSHGFLWNAQSVCLRLMVC